MTLEHFVEQRLRVAVADDEPFLQMYLEETIGLLGCDVTVMASDGQELFEKCIESRPDLIVTDVKMPRMDGLEAVRALSLIAPIPAVLLTGYGHLEALIREETRCIVAYLIKPVDEAALHRGIHVALLRFRQFKALLEDEGELEAAFTHRPLVEQAKFALMRHESIEEAQAFDMIVETAKERHQTIVAVCRSMLDTERAAAASRAKSYRTSADD